jgi:hypothetical protein
MLVIYGEIFAKRSMTKNNEKKEWKKKIEELWKTKKRPIAAM